jgi:hypothetical protein
METRERCTFAKKKSGTEEDWIVGMVLTRVRDIEDYFIQELRKRSGKTVPFSPLTFIQSIRQTKI